MPEGDIKRDITVIAKYEGMTIEEAKLTYAARQKLPAKAFCGPNRSYPAHDAKHVKSALGRLSQFGHRLPAKVRATIYKCLVRRAKRYGVEHDPKKYKWGKHVSETAKYDVFLDSILKWYLETQLE